MSAASRDFSWGTLAKRQVLGFAHGEISFDGIDSRHRRYRAAAEIDQCSDLQLSLAGDAVNGRNQAGKVEVDLGRFDSRFAGLDLRFRGGYRGLGGRVVLNGVVEILLTGGLFLSQGSVPVDVQLGSALHGLGVRQHGLGLRQLSLGLVKRGLKGARINLEEQLPFLNGRAFLVALPHEVAGHLRTDIGIGQSVEGADPLAINRNIPLFNLRNLNIRRTGEAAIPSTCFGRIAPKIKPMTSRQNAPPTQALCFQKVFIFSPGGVPHDKADILGFRTVR